MIPIHEARSKLIHKGYKVQLQPIYKELTILDAKYEEVKAFLTEQGYDGGIVVIGKQRIVKPSEAPRRVLEQEGTNIPPMVEKRDTENPIKPEGVYEQLTFEF